MMKSAVGFLVLLLVFCLRTEANKTEDFSYVLKLAGIRDLDIDQNFLRSRTIQKLTHPNSNWTVSNIPKNFDPREDPRCGKTISKIRNQGHCSSCWAVALTSVMTDRYCLEHPDHPFVEFSTEDVVFCCTECTFRTEANYDINACSHGGSSIKSLMYVYNEGVVTGSHFSNTGCKPYTKRTLAGKGSECALYCTNSEFDPTRSYTEDKVYAKEVFVAHFPSELTIQVELITNGPVRASLVTTEYFIMNYTGGIYRDPGTSKTRHSHAVRIIGWGEENGIRYWIVANSWGEKWGEKGFFKIIRGENHQGIEGFIDAFSLIIGNESYARTIDVKASVLPMVCPMVWPIYVLSALVLLYF